MLFLLCGCTANLAQIKLDAAQKGFVAKQATYGAFNLFSLEKITNPNLPVRIYIEGDGKAWLNKYTQSPDPTPQNSFFRDLALADSSSNVVYLARPCQYITSDICEAKFWGTERYSSPIIFSMTTALKNYGNNIELVGYSGGATIALIAAKELSYVKSITTIAGNLDPDAFTKYHNLTPLIGVSDISVIANYLSRANIPQTHYYGSDDEVITKEIIESYKSKFEQNNLAKFVVVPNATHNEGYAEYFKNHHLLGQ